MIVLKNVGAEKAKMKTDKHDCELEECSCTNPVFTMQCGCCLNADCDCEYCPFCETQDPEEDKNEED